MVWDWVFQEGWPAKVGSKDGWRWSWSWSWCWCWCWCWVARLESLPGERNQQMRIGVAGGRAAGRGDQDGTRLIRRLPHHQLSHRCRRFSLLRTHELSPILPPRQPSASPLPSPSFFYCTSNLQSRGLIASPIQYSICLHKRTSECSHYPFRRRNPLYFHRIIDFDQSAFRCSCISKYDSAAHVHNSKLTRYITFTYPSMEI
jgi:hypothetical protein